MNKKNDIYLFSHNYLINDWKDILKNQLNLIINSGLYDEMKNMFLLTCYENENDFDLLINLIREKDIDYKIIISKINENEFEYPTINKLYDFCNILDEDSYIFYFHLKGVWSTLDNTRNKEAIISWRKCLEYFNIEKWKSCIEKLNEGYDVVGALYNYNEKEPLFSGNFWWSNSNYIKKLKILNIDNVKKFNNDFTWIRVECEKWINSIPNRFYNFYIPKDYGFYYVPIEEKDYREDKNKDQISLCVMSVCYNEENILPFYLDYYTNFIKADKIIIYDGGSTDKTPEIIKNYSNVEFIIDDNKKMDERNLRDIRNNGWKKYRNIYDWMIVCDMDEFIYHPNLKNLLFEYKLKKITIPKINGYDMISQYFPKFEKGKYITSFIQNGIHEPIWLNKSAVFNPNSIDINYDYGTHSCNPIGNIKYSETTDIKLLQYKWLSLEYVRNKSLKSSQRLSDWNLETGMASHYKEYAKITENDFNIKLLSSFKVVDFDENKDYSINYRGIIINKRGYWMNDHLVEESFDNKLFENFLKLFKNKTVADFGCGHGYYTKKLLENNINVEGYDGNPYTEKITNNICKIQDLSSNFYLNKKFDWIACLEVGEHIPTEYENIFLDNIDKHCNEGIIISWAVVGQGGDGHVNCRNNDYVKNLFNNKGYFNDIYLEEKLRKECEISWFKDTLMVFRKKENIEKYKITVIIPTHNRNELLKECLNSVLMQNYNNMEILVCHDGQSDKYDYFKNYYKYDDRIKFYNTEKESNNLGASQRNKMIQISNGDYTLFLDDDNILYENYLNKMVSEIDENTGMVVCKIHFNDRKWNNLILPIENELVPTRIDHLSILFKTDIAKNFIWDNDWGQDHRYINNCENLIKNKEFEIKYINDILANHRYLGEKNYSKDIVIIYDENNNKEHLINFIKLFFRYNRKILLICNYSVDLDIQNMIDFYIMNNSSIIIENFYYAMDFAKDIDFDTFLCISSDINIREENFIDIDSKISEIKIKNKTFHSFDRNFFISVIS